MVMKKTKRKHLFRSVRAAGVSFFAVTLAVCLSVAVFHGFLSAVSAVLSSAKELGNAPAVLTGLGCGISAVFLAVSAAVCYACAARMTEEQREIIGTQKALGIPARDILSHYVTVHLLAILSGVLLGWMFGGLLVENLLLRMLEQNFAAAPIPLRFSWGSALLSGGVSLTLLGWVTVTACSRAVGEPTIPLLRGKPPVNVRPYAFETSGIYPKLSIAFRTLLKNLRNDRGGSAAAILGIAGSTSVLLFCGTLWKTADAYRPALLLCAVLAAGMLIPAILSTFRLRILRKVPELELLRRNGYTAGQTRTYLLKELLVLVLLGLLPGSAVGLALGFGYMILF